MPIEFWNDERVETLKKMWAEGHSATRIGVALDCSRGAVIGKMTRLRLPPPAEKLPVIADRTYVRQLPEITLANRRERERRYAKKRREDPKRKLAAKRNERERLIARGASPYSAVYRKQLPPLPEMTKGQLRAMLAQAIENTAAL